MKRPFMKHPLASYFLILLSASFLLVHCGEAAPYHPDAMSLQREAMKVYSRKPDSALAVLDKAIQMDPSYYLSYNTKAMVYIRKNDYQRAVAELHKSLRWNEDQGEVHMQIGMLNELQGMPERAADAFDRAIALFEMRMAEVSQHEVEDRCNYLLARIMRGETEAGGKELEKLLEQHPEHPLVKRLEGFRTAADSGTVFDKTFYIEALLLR